jgi:RNA polymerase sigma-70 factor (ECF subfamily)
MSGLVDGCDESRPNMLCTKLALEEVRAGVVRYTRELRAFARSLTQNPASADDLAQEAILRALACAHQYKPGTNFKAWIFTILRNSYFNEHRKRMNSHRSLDCLKLYGQPYVPANQDAYLEMCDVRRAFGRLGPLQREVLMLIGPGDLSYEEAARVCGCRVGTIKSRASRARKELLQMMKEPPHAARRDLPAMAGRYADDALRD